MQQLLEKGVLISGVTLKQWYRTLLSRPTIYNIQLWMNSDLEDMMQLLPTELSGAQNVLHVQTAV